MRAVIQRVASARVEIDGYVVSEIRGGLLVLVGVAKGDTPEEARRLSEKVVALRVFEDSDRRMNRDIREAEGSILCVSQFTLFAELRRGNRPSFDEAAVAPDAEPIYNQFCDGVERTGITCQRGVFGADMQVHLVNDGPVTLLLDTASLARPRRA